jgi:diacylglycerol kinase family enzyme
MYETLLPGDLVFVDGGDGTVAQAINGQLSETGIKLGLNGLPTVYWKGGYAHDFASQLHGDLQLAEVLGHPGESWLHPLEMSVTHDNVPLLERKVAAYSGIGGTALASYGVDQLKQSPSRIVQTKLGRKAASVVVSLHQVAVSPKMTITDAVSGIQQKAKDITIVNGSRMAIYGKLHARLDREDFEEITTSPWGHIGTLVSMLKLQHGSLYGKLLSTDDFIVTSKNGGDVPIHFDGDRRFIPSGSEVSVGISRHAVRALAPMLSNTVDH